jgi:hypothetical protein
MSIANNFVKRRMAYSMKTKQTVILYAEIHGNRPAQREYNIDEATIRQWRQQRDRIFTSNSSRKTFRGPKTGANVEVEERVVNFIKEKRAQALPVTRRMLQSKALEAAADLGISDFKASHGWCTRFMKRHGFSLRRRTSVCQKLPSHYEEKLMAYQKYIINLRQKMHYTLEHMGNADETPVYFDMPRNETIDTVGSKEVKLITTGYEKQRITVMLAITADGNKLPPFLILKRKNVPKNETFPSGVIVRAQEKGWMTQELMLEWIKLVWNRRPGFSRNPPNMLVLDAFKGHLTDSVKKMLKESSCDLAVIPGGLTSQLQPLDVSLNKPFKAYLRDEYDAWLSTENLPLTKTGKFKKAPPSTIAKWVASAWAKIDVTIVQKSFKKTCISNALDGTEDDLLWEDTIDESSSSSEESSSAEED